jgi:hypothetical protein
MALIDDTPRSFWTGVLTLWLASAIFLLLWRPFFYALAAAT